MSDNRWAVVPIYAICAWLERRQHTNHIPWNFTNPYQCQHKVQQCSYAERQSTGSYTPSQCMLDTFRQALHLLNRLSSTTPYNLACLLQSYHRPRSILHNEHTETRHTFLIICHCHQVLEGRHGSLRREQNAVLVHRCPWNGRSNRRRTSTLFHPTQHRGRG
jgi:hypothetical protein